MMVSVMKCEQIVDKTVCVITSPLPPSLDISLPPPTDKTLHPQLPKTDSPVRGRRRENEM